MSGTTGKTRARLIKRLDPYWKMEAGNMALIPLIVLILTKAQVGWIIAVPLLAVVLLLGIGAAYWRFKVQQLRGDAVSPDNVLRWIAVLQRPALALTLAAIASAAFGWLVPSWSAGFAERVAASVCALLAALEYVNYYHRQLQHFDNVADFRRMLGGKGFRQSWLARDLAEWRRV